MIKYSKFILISLGILFSIQQHSLAQDLPGFRIGGGGMYNARIAQLGIHGQLEIPIVRDIEFSPQITRFWGSFDEYYVDANFNLYFLEGETANGIYYDLYLLIGYALEYWENSYLTSASGSPVYVGPAYFHGFDIGMGIRGYLTDKISLFADVRYYSNHKEIALTVGSKFSFYFSRRRKITIDKIKPSDLKVNPNR